MQLKKTFIFAKLSPGNKKKKLNSNDPNKHIFICNISIEFRIQSNWHIWQIFNKHVKVETAT